MLIPRKVKAIPDVLVCLRLGERDNPLLSRRPIASEPVPGDSAAYTTERSIYLESDGLEGASRVNQLNDLVEF